MAAVTGHRLVWFEQRDKRAIDDQELVEIEFGVPDQRGCHRRIQRCAAGRRNAAYVQDWRLEPRPGDGICPVGSDPDEIILGEGRRAGVYGVERIGLSTSSRVG